MNPVNGRSHPKVGNYTTTAFVYDNSQPDPVDCYEKFPIYRLKYRKNIIETGYMLIYRILGHIILPEPPHVHQVILHPS